MNRQYMIEIDTVKSRFRYSIFFTSIEKSNKINRPFSIVNRFPIYRRSSTDPQQWSDGWEGPKLYIKIFLNITK